MAAGRNVEALGAKLVEERPVIEAIDTGKRVLGAIAVEDEVIDAGVLAAIGAATLARRRDIAGEAETSGRPRESTSHSYDATFNRGVTQSTKAMPFKSAFGNVSRHESARDEHQKPCDGECDRYRRAVRQNADQQAIEARVEILVVDHRDKHNARENRGAWPESPEGQCEQD